MTPSDVEQLLKVVDASAEAPLSGAWPSEHLEIVSLLGDCTLITVDADGFCPAAGNHPAGVLLSGNGGQVNEVIVVAVLPEYRRRGLATAMLRQFMLDSVERGAQCVAAVWPCGHPAEALIDKAGFELAGERAGYFAGDHGEAIDGLYVIKELSDD